MASIPDRAAPPSPFSPGRLAALLAILTLAVVALYLPTLRHLFVFDDDLYITANPMVQEGLGWEGLHWALTSLDAGYWHPLAWLSHMADVQLFGLNPGPHHFAGFLLHAVNSGLLLFVLARLTGAFWRSALVGALFALHPLHVESVSWVSERKDVLLGLFWLLAMLAYERSARVPGPARRSLVAVFFILALASKPMAVALPLTLLTLDGWPLGRLSRADGRLPLKPILTEKAFLLALAASDSVLTVYGSYRGDGLPTLEVLPLTSRFENAAVAIVIYLVQTFWPFGLAVHYPLRPEGPSAPAWISATFVIAAITIVAYRQRRSRPWVAAGWAWYLVTLLPAVGVVQLGFYARADRYTYLPLIGIFVIIAWGGRELLAGLRHGAVAGAAAAVFVLLLLAAIARVQVGFWRDPVSLFSHALVVTEGNWLAHYGLGQALRAGGDATAAAEHYRSAIALNPGYKEARNNLGILLAERGDPEGALAQFQEALRYRPRSADLHYNAGLALEALGRDAEAARAFRRAMDLEPGRADARAALDKLEGETR